MMLFNDTGEKKKQPTANKRPELKLVNTFSKHANQRELLIQINKTVGQLQNTRTRAS